MRLEIKGNKKRLSEDRLKRMALERNNRADDNDDVMQNYLQSYQLRTHSTRDSHIRGTSHPLPPAAWNRTPAVCHSYFTFSAYNRICDLDLSVEFDALGSDQLESSEAQRHITL